MHLAMLTQHTFLDVVIRESASIFELLASENQSLLIRRDSFLVLDLGLHIVDRVRCFHFEGDGFAGQRLDKDLHAATKSEHEMESGLLLNVVVGQGTTILELLASEDQSLLVWWNALLVLDLSLDILDSVTGFHLESDRLASEGFHENLHATAQTEHQVQGRLWEWEEMD